jgi:hypothetical protein
MTDQSLWLSTKESRHTTCLLLTKQYAEEKGMGGKERDDCKVRGGENGGLLVIIFVGALFGQIGDESSAFDVAKS